MPQITRRHSNYQPESVGIGIVHIGLGAFHRAHQAWYQERWLSEQQGGNWGICAASIRSNRALVDQLTAQRGRYHVAAYSSKEQVEVTEVQSIREALFAGQDKARLLERLTNAATRIVSLTVTEKAYHLSPASGELLVDDPDIAHDLADPRNPRTALGLVLEGLKRRRQASLPPFTVLCCDNMPENGVRVREAVTTLAAVQSPALAAWIAAEVPFPCTMVDRIVPAVTDNMRAQLEQLIGEPDPVAVACEDFTQWVVEDRFADGRPDWERVGVEMVTDVSPFETMKLRLLNGAHSLLAYVGLARGRRTVSDAIADPALNTLVRDYFVEAAKSLQPAPGMDPETYTDRLLERFGNDALEHHLSQIAMDGSQKLPQRWLRGAETNLLAGRPIDVTAAGLAAWLAYVRGRNDRGDTWPVDDPLAASLAGCHQASATAQDLVGSLLDVREVFPPALAEHPGFRAALLQAYLQLDGSTSH